MRARNGRVVGRIGWDVDTENRLISWTRLARMKREKRLEQDMSILLAENKKLRRQRDEAQTAASELLRQLHEHGLAEEGR